MKINSKTNLSLLLKRLIRDCAGARNNCRINIVLGKQSPKLDGKKSHYTNISGEIIYHPNAYAKKGRRSMVYHSSTVRVDVGAEWLMNNISIESIKLEKIKLIK